MKLQKLAPLTLFLASSFIANTANAAILTADTYVSLFSDTSLTYGDETFLYGIDQIGLNDIAKFNSSLGTLNSATIMIDGQLTYDFFIDGIGVMDESLSSSMSTDINTGIGASVPIGSINQLRAEEIVPNYIECYEDAGFGPCMDFYGGTAMLAPVDVFTGAELGIFIGTGTPINPFTGEGSLVDIDIMLLAGIDGLFSDNIIDPMVNIDLSFDGIVIVQYDYTPATVVPVPAAAWLFISGLAGLIVPAVRRRR